MSHASRSKSNPPVCLEAVSGADNDKREKIRQKNERKHQRKKERRAEELRERCRIYLMSKKLDQLAQRLVPIGFSHERAKIALALNEGSEVEALAWLFKNDEDANDQNDKTIDMGGNLKIDISKELARIADMEIRYGCSKQEVERVIVSCEGDLEKTAEILRESKHDPPSAPPPKLEETGDPPIINNGKQAGVSSQLTTKNMPFNGVSRQEYLSNSLNVAYASSSNFWQQKYTNLEAAFKAYLMMKEGRIPQEVADILDSSNPHVASESHSLSLLNARGSHGESNI